jgi:hypothetical protein
MTSLVAFKSALLGGGARANQFRVSLTFPSVANNQAAGLAAPFLVKAASLPAIDIGVAPVYYHGRLVPLAGERTFNPWTVTVYNDNNFLLRNAMEDWSNAMNNFINNTGVTSPFAYKADAEVHQLDRNGAVLKTYKFVGMFPQAISEIGLDFGLNDQVEEFSVTFAYEHYETQSEGLIAAGINIGGVGINI